MGIPAWSGSAPLFQQHTAERTGTGNNSLIDDSHCATAIAQRTTMSHPPRALVRRSAQEASRLQREDELAAREDYEENDEEAPGAAAAHADEGDEPGLDPALPLHQRALEDFEPAHQQQHAGAPGGPQVPVHAEGADPAAAAAVDPLAEDDDLLCVICMAQCGPADPIHSCGTCALVVHLECMRIWLREAEAKKKVGRCPGCNTLEERSSFELAYWCWCHEVCWDAAPALEGRQPAHSCGDICGARRPGNCPHPCEHVCHRGMCRPCGHMRENVRCAGNHVTYPPFPCGAEPANKCTLTCGQVQPCGHPCAAPCHGPDQPHAACIVPVEKTCACGKARADDAASGGGVRVPCSQVVVQCGAPCGQLQPCGLHRCERICHAGACQEQLVASAWGKGSWVRVGPSASAVAAPASRPGVGASDFPALGGGPSAAARAAASPLPAASASGGFRSCGKPCGRRRACGHPCSAACHPLAAAPAAESKEDGDASPSSACDAFKCTQLVSLSCPCGRKSEKVRCSERDAAPRLQQQRSLQRCDHVCAVVAQGKLFEAELDRATREDPQAIGERRTMLPYPASLLALLCGGGAVGPASAASASGGGSSAHALSSEAQFLRKTETQLRKFVMDLAASLDREEEAAVGAGVAAASQPASRNNVIRSSGVASAAATAATHSVRHLFLSGLTSSRRLLVSQLALATQLFFDVDDSSLRAHAPQGALGRSAASALSSSLAASAAATPSQPRSRGNSAAEERKEHDVAQAAASAEEEDEEAKQGDVVDDPLAANMPRTSFLLPSLSLMAAAELYKPAAHLPSLCTAESWPGSLRVRLQFDSSSIDEPAAQAEGQVVLRWLAPFFGVSRACWTTPRQLSVLFGSALRARQCYSHLQRVHAAELASNHVQVQAPERSGAADVVALVADETAAAAEQKRSDALQRAQREAEFAALQARQAKQRAANPASAASVLPQVPSAAKHAVSTVRSALVGHNKVALKQTNVWAALADSDGE